ncbi:class I SAM-dependent methyltransferase [Spongiactinospora sp. TRM90649]|uniref:class I SAM-dependent methyltransferase n=1 Tax=Spongiactinospora sp. TRM90649 TaxID=3031114 RepID=UPI0023F8302F|nr:class I SAM-dependent methyltransferase [Spongiactinospora sp. TRM90649]MDF5758997.1 class I SAM-dependent methyltransferase [Spongiactinospora sp. TRM90649]
MKLPVDHDADPEGFLRAALLTERHALPYAPGLGVPGLVARRLARAGSRLILDIGCGDGALSAAVAEAFENPPWPARSPDGEPGGLVVGLDGAMALAGLHPGPVVRGDAMALPYADGVFDAAVAINTLCHLADPAAALREARRVLRPGGLFAAATVARADSPELADVWRPSPTAFDAEEAVEIVAGVFGEVEVDRWDLPLIRLPDEDAVRDYLVARGVPHGRAARAARRVDTPVTLTKRGVAVYAIR